MEQEQWVSVSDFGFDNCDFSFVLKNTGYRII